MTVDYSNVVQRLVGIGDGWLTMFGYSVARRSMAAMC